MHNNRTVVYISNFIKLHKRLFQRSTVYNVCDINPSPTSVLPELLQKKVLVRCNSVRFYVGTLRSPNKHNLLLKDELPQRRQAVLWREKTVVSAGYWSAVFSPLNKDEEWIGTNKIFKQLSSRAIERCLFSRVEMQFGVGQILVLLRGYILKFAWKKVSLPPNLPNTGYNCTCISPASWFCCCCCCWCPMRAD